MPDLRSSSDRASPNLLRRVKILAYGLLAAVPLVVAWLPLEWIIGRFLYEDYFYYLGVARHIVEGHGATADGVAMTNGFHPLWMLVCVAGQALLGPTWVIHGVLTVAAALHLGQGVLVFRILRTVAGPVAAHMAAFFWLANYRVLAVNLCGLETPLAIVMLLGTLLHLLGSGRSSGGGQRGMRWALELGLLLGLSVLARFDLALLAVLVVGAVAFFLEPNLALRVRLRDACLSGVVGLLLLIPWFVWSYGHSGTLLPNSHVALNVWAFRPLRLEYGLEQNLMVFRNLVFGGSWWFLDVANLLGLWPLVFPRIDKMGLVVMAFLFATTVWLLRDTRRDEYARWRLLLAAFAWSHFAYYGLFARLDVRYLMPFSTAMVLFYASTLRAWLHEPSRARWVYAVYAGLLVNATIAGVGAWHHRQGAARTHASHENLLDMAHWIREHVREDAVLGGWNSGITAYFSGHELANLDGVINDEVIDSIRARELARYIEHRRIAYIVDETARIERFMTLWSGDPDWRDDYVLVHSIGSVRLLRRVTRPARAIER